MLSCRPTVCLYFFKQIYFILRHPQQLLAILSRCSEIYQHQGICGLLEGFKRDLKQKSQGYSPSIKRVYRDWLQNEPKPQVSTKHHNRSCFFSVIIIEKEIFQEETVRTTTSIKKQTLSDWEIFVIQQRPTATNIIQIPSLASHPKKTIIKSSIQEALQTTFKELKGDYFTFLEPGDYLVPEALETFMSASTSTPEPIIIYSDSDKIDGSNVRFSPNFKPGWNRLLLEEYDYLTRPVFFHTSSARLHKLIPGQTCNQRDLALLLSEEIQSTKIRHIPHILCHCHERQQDENIITKPEITKPITKEIEPSLVSIIIPTKNNHTILERAIASLSKTDYLNTELLIVDNGSNDETTISYLNSLQKSGKIKVLNYNQPFNYSAINNYAVQHAAGNVFCFLNDDIEIITSSWLTKLLEFSIRQTTGAVGPMLLYPDNTIQQAGIMLGNSAFNSGGLACHAFSGHHKDYAGPNNRLRYPQYVSAVTGACLVVRKNVFEEVDGFDTKLSVTMNDVDLCLRIKEKGYNNVLVPTVSLYHYESASRGKDDNHIKEVRSSQEVLYMRKKWGKLLTTDPLFPTGNLGTVEWI